MSSSEASSSVGVIARFDAGRLTMQLMPHMMMESVKLGKESRSATLDDHKRNIIKLQLEGLYIQRPAHGQMHCGAASEAASEVAADRNTDTQTGLMIKVSITSFRSVERDA